MTVSQHEEAIGEGERFLWIVGHDDGRRVRFVESCRKLGDEGCPGLGIEGGERFVEERISGSTAKARARLTRRASPPERRRAFCRTR